MNPIPQTVFLRHAGGGEAIEHDWPLSEVLQYQLDKGMVSQVSHPGPATWYEEPAVESKPVSATHRFTPPKELPPHRNASKAEWVGFAARNGMKADEAELLTKADLVERFGG
jgi:hypothetical protein